jgi:hypothetical protein
VQQNPTLDGQKVVPWSSSTSPSLQVCCSKPKNLVEPSVFGFFGLTASKL